MSEASTFSEGPIAWFLANIFETVPNIFSALYNYNLWLDWLTWTNTTEDKQVSKLRFLHLEHSAFVRKTPGLDEIRKLAKRRLYRLEEFLHSDPLI